MSEAGEEWDGDAVGFGYRVFHGNVDSWTLPVTMNDAGNFESWGGVDSILDEIVDFILDAGSVSFAVIGRDERRGIQYRCGSVEGLSALLGEVASDGNVVEDLVFAVTVDAYAFE